MYKLAIGDRVEFRVTLRLKSGGSIQTYPIDFIANRMNITDWLTAVGNAASEKYPAETVDGVATMLCQQIIGWKNQRLVVDEDNNPVDFSVEALRLIFALPTVVGIVSDAFKEAISEASGDTGRRKNSSS